jgi:uncharacterized protein DUF6766
MSSIRRFLFENSLTIAFGLLFLGALAGQAVAGHAEFNNDQDRHHADHISLGRYVTSAQFGAAVMENWQSEYLQFTLFLLLTVWFVQRGSPESKRLDKAGRESDREQRVGEHAKDRSPTWARARGLKLALYSNSLLVVMALIWVGSWFAQSITGRVEFNAERLSHQETALSWAQYIGSSNFWERTLENWQSEFLAVGSFAILAVYLRQRGSPESKPVGAEHDATGVQG